jgi:cytochrome b pre-mRNA-processing protein 3
VLASLFGRSGRQTAAQKAYGKLVARARDPVFFLRWGVPDTLDGRFDVLALHAFLLFNRLKRERAETEAFAQILFDYMFADLDRGVREMGATDIGVGRQVKAMARGFYGRVAAYEKGLGDAAELQAALRRNLYGTVAPQDAHVAAIAAYLQRQVAALAAIPVAELLAGEVPFAPIESTR